MFNIFFSIILTLGFHHIYQEINGYLSKKPPAYHYHTGFFLISAFTPIIEFEDFQDKNLALYVSQNIKYDLKDHRNRSKHHWEYGGLVEVLNRFTQNSLEANQLTKKLFLTLWNVIL